MKRKSLRKRLQRKLMQMMTRLTGDEALLDFITTLNEDELERSILVLHEKGFTPSEIADEVLDKSLDLPEDFRLELITQVITNYNEYKLQNNIKTTK